tara:strand:+ start:593 stop:1765 length:1173 start_codon:yes stop_codon:yes gene_type:complete
VIEIDRWILPDGFEDVLPERAMNVEYLRRDLLDLYNSWGYDLIIPPMLEYMDSLLVEAGRDLDLLTFRVTDQVSGKMMGIRADITPQVARIDAHSFARDGISRLCYAGTVLHARARDPLSSRAPNSIGVELFGEKSVDADIEAVTLFLESLRLVDISDVCLDLGHVDICRGLLKSAGLKSPLQSEFYDLLQRKAEREIESWIANNVRDSRLARWLSVLPSLVGDSDILQVASSEFSEAPDEVVKAIEQLSRLASSVEDANTSLHFDLSEIPGFHYHTGLVFAGFARGNRKVLGNGGRYDCIGKAFGRNRPATGFAFDLNLLAELSNRKIPSQGAVWCFVGEDELLINEARKLRKAGQRVVQLFEERSSEAMKSCDKQLLNENGRAVVRDL